MSEILVTGGAGFIGSHIADAYISKGHKVAIIDNLSTGRSENINLEAVFYQMDILDSKLESVFEERRPRIVNHHAAQIDIKKSVEDPLFDARTNIMGLLNVLQLCAKYGVERFIYSSSAGVYGEPEYLPVDIDHPTNPLSPYGVSKLASEHYIKSFAKLYGLDYSILRYANVYGPRQESIGEAGVVSIFIKRILSDRELIIYGDGEQLRDYIYIDDAVSANISATLAKESLLMNIGTGRSTSVNGLSRLIGNATKKETGAVYKPSRPGDLEKIYFKQEDNALNWQAKTKLEEGLEKTINYFSSKKRG